MRALGAALASQQGSSRLITQLADQLHTAAAALQAQSAAAAKATNTGARTGQGGSAGSSGSVASAEVTVLKSQQALASAQQAVAAATLKAPVDGTIGAVGLTAGQSAGTSQSIVIVGQGTALVTVDIPLAQLASVKVNQDVRITPSGATSTVPGVVQSIGVLPTSTTSTTPTYPVVIAVDDAPITLATSSQASAAITLARAADALTIPVSALAGISQGIGTVSVLADGTTTSTRVGIGAIGQGKAQVLSGVSAGQIVVLADPSQALPTANAFGGQRSVLGGGGGFAGPPGGRAP